MYVNFLTLSTEKNQQLVQQQRALLVPGLRPLHTHQQQPGCVDTWLIAGLGREVYDAILEHCHTRKQ